MTPFTPRQTDQGSGVPASPSGCQPTASAAEGASSQSGIPNADKALANALARREEILKQLPTLRGELTNLERFILAWFRMAGQPCPFVTNGARGLPRTANSPKEYVAEQAAAILREAGEPMGRRELLGALSDRGIVLHGKDPAMVLTTMLWRCPSIIKRTPAGYVPAASAIETQRATTAGRGPQDESATPQEDAQRQSPKVSQ